MPNMLAISATVTLALISHGYFKQVEPRPFPFAGGIIGAVVLGSPVLSSTTNVVFFEAFGRMCFLTILYLAVLSCSILVYRLSPLHPLAQFPGPKLASTTKWWMVYRIVFSGGRHKYFESLHAKYGPWVRVGPNELSVNIPTAIRSVYKLDRGSFYAGTPAKADSLITVMDRSVHSHRRQAWTRAVTGDAMYSYVPSTQKRVKQLLAIIRREGASGQPLNFDDWLNLFFMDLMGDMGFSGGFETMNEGRDKEGWLHILAIGVIFVSIMGQVPWLQSLLQMLPQKGPIETFHKFTGDKVEEIKARTPKESGRDILGVLLDPQSDNRTLTKDEAAADATLIVVGATDTSVQTVLTFFRYVCADKTVQQRLQKELNDVFDDDFETVDVDALMRLPYLDACVQEALRIMPPGPFGPPRSSGRSGVLIENNWIAPYTTLHMPVYAMHRDHTNFGLGNKFIPERWLDDGDVRKSADIKLLAFNRDAFVPFSAGYSSCVGKHLALQNIKILLGYMIHSFNVALVPQFNEGTFDASYKEYGLWTHDPLHLVFSPRPGSADCVKQ